MATVDLDQGMRSRELGSEAVRAMWAECEALNEQHAGPGRYVPVRALVVDDAISPRHVDADTVAAYADNADLLPPVLVQQGTLVLVDGRHRLHAVIRASRDYILVQEEEIADEELRDRAIRANVGHGRPYTLDERIANARDIMHRHPGWSAPMVAEWSGMSRRWVADQKAREQQRESERENRPVQSAPVAAKVSTRDGRVITPTPGNLSARTAAPVRSYDPGPEREPDDSDAWDEPEPAVPTARITAEVGLNPAAFRVGDVVRNIHTGEKFEVGPTGRDGCARFRGLGGARDCTPNALNNPRYALVMAASSSPAEPAVAGRPDRGFTYVADGIAMRGSVPAGVSWEAVERLESAFNTFLRSL